jgi:hypothetical protein
MTASHKVAPAIAQLVTQPVLHFAHASSAYKYIVTSALI